MWEIFHSRMFSLAGVAIHRPVNQTSKWTAASLYALRVFWILSRLNKSQMTLIIVHWTRYEVVFKILHLAALKKVVDSGWQKKAISAIIFINSKVNISCQCEEITATKVLCNSVYCMGLRALHYNVVPNFTLRALISIIIESFRTKDSLRPGNQLVTGHLS